MLSLIGIWLNFPKQPVTDSLQLLVSGEETSPLNINQDARIYAGRMNKSTKITHNVIGKAYVLISEGNIEVNGKQGSKRRWAFYFR